MPPRSRANAATSVICLRLNSPTRCVSKPISRWAVPLAIALSLPVSITAGREFGGESLGLRLLYGGAAGVVLALAVMGVFALLARRPDKDA